jgi:hypothetical protein
MSIHDPDVVYTDLGLALLGAYLAWRLWKARRSGFLTRAGFVIMAGLASAALWGAIFHAFFPANTATRAGFIAWIPVSLSIVVVATTLLSLGLRLLTSRLSPVVRKPIVAIYALCFAFVVLFVDESYATIVRFYGPTLILFLIAAALQGLRGGGSGWWVLAISLTISIVAALLQQAEWSIHPVYFDHNAVYHVLQGVAIVLLYLGFRRVGAYASRTDRARRAR